VKPWVFAELAEESGEIGDGKFAPSAVHQLDRLAALEIDAGNQHGSRTSTPLSRK